MHLLYKMLHIPLEQCVSPLLLPMLPHASPLGYRRHVTFAIQFIDGFNPYYTPPPQQGDNPVVLSAQMQVPPSPPNCFTQSFPRDMSVSAFVHRFGTASRRGRRMTLS